MTQPSTPPSFQLIAEELLHYVWKFNLFDHANLQTTDHPAEPLHIVSVGQTNTHAGPDFQEAKIQIHDTLWVGHVEIHCRSSDWQKHQHQLDKAYDNVVLHVVYEYDKPTFRSDGSLVPVLELKNRIYPQVLANSETLLQSIDSIPCEKQLPHLHKINIDSWLARMLVERLEQKLTSIEHYLHEQQGSWDYAFYLCLARNFGFKINALPFEMLARSLPQSLLAKCKNDSIQIEALLFGQAGLLNQVFTDEYPQCIQKEYQFLQKKYQLQALEASIWKFMRTRPHNFPSIRIAQFSALIIRSNHLFSKIIDATNASEIRQLFTQLTPHPYWEQHYRFDRMATSASPKIMGTSAIDNLLINTVALFLFAYGKHMGSDQYIDRALALLENIPIENNAIVDHFASLGLNYQSAFYSQALLQLRNNYCAHKKCLSCGIGALIIQKNKQ